MIISWFVEHLLCLHFKSNDANLINLHLIWAQSLTYVCTWSGNLLCSAASFWIRKILNIRVLVFVKMRKSICCGACTVSAVHRTHSFWINVCTCTHTAKPHQKIYYIGLTLQSMVWINGWILACNTRSLSLQHIVIVTQCTLVVTQMPTAVGHLTCPNASSSYEWSRSGTRWALWTRQDVAGICCANSCY